MQLEEDVEIAGVNALCDKLESLGFGREDALAASKATKSKDIAALDGAISWLCVHVPDYRLPTVYAPKSLNEGGVVLLSKTKPAQPVEIDSRPSSEDAAWLWERGYAATACDDALRAHSSREEAHAHLFGQVLAGISKAHEAWPTGDPDASDEDWEDELTAIEAICGEDTVERLPAGVRVAIDTSAGVKGYLEVYRLKNGGYPAVEPPLIAFHAHGELRAEFFQRDSSACEARH